jgi:hypothetical protein
MGEEGLSLEINRLHISGLDNIKLLGFRAHPTYILGEASEFVSIQTKNNHPSQSVLEAMNCGNTIIASDVMIHVVF